MASTTVLGPVTTSPPAKTPGRLVASVSRSIRTVPLGVMSTRLAPATATQSVSEPSLMATTSVSSGTAASVPGIGTGRRRPLASTSPSRFFTSSMPVKRPSSTRSRTGEVSVSIRMPSVIAASTSSAKAGISSRVRR